MSKPREMQDLAYSFNKQETLPQDNIESLINELKNETASLDKLISFFIKQLGNKDATLSKLKESDNHNSVLFFT
jgi:hypothetical protein